MGTRVRWRIFVESEQYRNIKRLNRLIVTVLSHEKRKEVGVLLL